jgi:cytochrome c
MFRLMLCAIGLSLCVPALAGPLHDAAGKGDVETVRELIAEGFDVNQLDTMVGTPLTKAAECGQMEIVKLLLEFGADVSAMNDQGEEPIEFAGASAHFDVVDLLRENGALPPVPIEPVSGLLSAADPERGQVLFRDRGCLRCHDASADGHDVDEGPKLWGIVGRAKASGTFPYSEALQRVGGVWSYEDLNAWLYEPKRFAPGNKMSLRHLVIVGSRGTPEVQDRADLIAYLRLQSDDPVSLP